MKVVYFIVLCLILGVVSVMGGLAALDGRYMLAVIYLFLAFVIIWHIEGRLGIR